MLRPTVIDLVLLPPELRRLNQWVVWRLEQREGKPTKVPYCAKSPGDKASTTDPATWASFDQALQVVEGGQVDGLGFVFAEDDPFCGIDLDAEATEEQRQAVLALDSYTEASVSGHGGLHVIVQGSLNGWPRHRSGPLEVYDSGRYFVMTGDQVPGSPNSVEERQVELGALLARYLPPRSAAVPARPVQPVALDDRELLDKAFASRNGADFQRLYSGDLTGYPSPSEADLAFCCVAAFWTGRDPARIDAWLRSSGLYREKWERQDYRERTIQTAIDGTREVYEPRVPNGVRPPSALDSEADLGGLPGACGGEQSYGVSLIGLRTPTPTLHRENRGEAERSQGSDSDADSGLRGGRPFSLPAKDFIERERRQAKALMTDEEGRAILAALSLILVGALGGHGKTTLTMQLLLHLVAGVDFPPFTVPEPVDVLVIENEGPEELFAEKLKAQLAAFPHELKGRLDICTVDWGSFSLADPELRERLTAEIRDKGYDLIVGDPLDSLGIKGVGSPEDTRDFMALMKETGLHKTVAWWLNTHPRKEEAREALNEIAGAWGGKPDTVLLLTRLEGDRTRVRFPKLRWAKRGTRPSILLAFDADTEAFTFIGEEAEEQRDVVSEMRALLSDGTKRLVKEIAAKKEEGGIGINERTAKRQLTEHPDVFKVHTGDAARALGRKANAELWGLASEPAEPAQTDLLDELLEPEQ